MNLNLQFCSPTPINQVARLAGLSTAFVALLMAGCGGSEQATENKQDSVTPEVVKTKTETVAVSAVNAEVSPATQPVRLPDVDATPEEVCELFVKHLNLGERVKAERLLTSAALSTTAKAGLYLQPIGGQQAKVTIKPAIYATNKKTLAQVDCVVNDVEDGKAVSDELTWVIRKSKSGWRVLGFMLKNESGVNDFLSFENMRDVDAILQMSSASPNQSVGDQAKRSSDTTSLR